MFKDNPQVAFADSALSAGGPRGGPGVSPGAGGWPTIRYYNKETGPNGANYRKKTSMAMCSELGPDGMSGGTNGYMIDYILEASGTSLCSINEPFDGCSEKEKKFIAKVSSLPAEDVSKREARLLGMKGGRMAPDLAKWLNQRLAILKQVAGKAKKDEL